MLYVIYVINDRLRCILHSQNDNETLFGYLVLCVRFQWFRG
ncbi:MAG: hypothetical protein M2R45_02731 [Verrucomicrobia subdivision 3 bacterium]|nr:hypothetical protein [Limisphaerales bacterium]MCS1415071.1 hypothetical protein [Limisphaerales bacterium]